MDEYRQRVAHADAALRQATAVVALARADLRRSGVAHAQQLDLRLALYALRKRQALLEEAYLDLVDSEKARPNDRWLHFLDAYEAFNEVSRQQRRAHCGAVEQA